MMKYRNLGERMIRDKNEVTLPIPVRDFLNLKPGDLIRFELSDNVVSIHKVITRKVVNNNSEEDEV